MSEALKLVERLAAASVVAMAALALAAPADSTPKKTKFVSKRYHYTLVLPGGSGRWVETHALVNWSGSFPRIGNTAFDYLSDVKTGRKYLIAARRVSKTTTLAKWTEFVVSRDNPGCKPLPRRSPAKLGGAPARRHELTCAEGAVIALAAIHAHRGYVFICVPFTPRRAAARRTCLAAQRAFHYTDA